MSSASRRNLPVFAFAVAVVAALLWILGRDSAPDLAPAEQPVAKPAKAQVPPPPAPAVAEPAADEEATSQAPPVRLIPATVEEDANAEFGAFDGRVVNFGSGKGLAGVEVVFAHAGTATTVRSTDDGRFAFAPPGPGTYRLAVATAEGFLPFAPEWGQSPVALTAHPQRRISGIIIYMIPAIDYTGVVVDGAGAPVSDAAVRLLDTPAAEFALSPIPTAFTSGANGEFLFHAPDDALLEAEHPAHGRGRARMGSDAQMTHRLEIRLTEADTDRAAAGRIAGRVADSEGKPVPGAAIRAIPQRSQPGPVLHASRHLEADDSGAFSFDDLDAPAYLIHASRDGYARTTVSALLGEESVEVVLEPAASIHGRVVSGSDSTPVPAFTVAVLQGKTELLQRVVAHTSVFDANGEFTIDGLEPGEYGLRAMAYGYAPSAPVRASATSKPDGGDEVTVELLAGGTLFGTVVGAPDGKPLDHARVTVEGGVGRGSSAMPLISTYVTDASGEFELAGLSSGRASVHVAAFDHNPRIIGGLVVADGSRSGPITVALSPVKEGEKPRLELVGIGVVLAPSEDGLEILRLIEGGGAAEAGLLPGEIITAVEGMPVVSGSMQDAIQKIRGPEGSRVVLTVKKLDGSSVTVAAPRRRIKA